MDRRQFIRSGTLAIAASAPSCAWSAINAGTVSGGALAVVKDRRLVYVRGYGWADREKRIAANPASLFRIASISKPFTAVAVMKLIEEGKLSLDTKAFPLLNLRPVVMSFRDPEPRLREITIQKLIQNTGGWD